MNITRKTPLKEILKLGEDCKKCGHCCKFDSGFLIKEDIQKISKFLNISEEQLKKKYLKEVEKFNTKLFKPKLTKKPFGRCIFLHNNLCKIHPVKPLLCKLGTCSEHGENIAIWFTSNYFVNEYDPESIRQWKTYLDSGGKTIPGGKLNELIKDKKILKKILNYEVLK